MPEALDLAHGITASLSWVVFFPLGATLIRVLKTNNSIWIHAAIQGSTILLLTAAVVTGILLTDHGKLSDYHPAIGLVLYGVIFAQAAGGILHHLLFKKYHRRTIVSYMHIWLGRILITLGMINGGLGLLYAGNSTRGQNIAYGVVAGVIWLVYIAVAVWYSVTEKRPAEVREGSKEELKQEQ